MSWLIYKGQLIARVNEELKSGEKVCWSDSKTHDSQLINPCYTKASNAEKWEKVYYSESCRHLLTAQLISDDGLYKRYYVTFSDQ